jgi:hypothetical protein
VTNGERALTCFPFISREFHLCPQYKSVLSSIVYHTEMQVDNMASKKLGTEQGNNEDDSNRSNSSNRTRQLSSSMVSYSYILHLLIWLIFGCMVVLVILLSVNIF